MVTEFCMFDDELVDSTESTAVGIKVRFFSFGKCAAGIVPLGDKKKKRGCQFSGVDH